MHTQAYVLNQQGVTIFRIISASRTFTALRSNGGALDIARARGTVLRSDLWARQDKRLFQYGSQEAGLVKYDKYTCKK